MQSLHSKILVNSSAFLALIFFSASASQAVIYTPTLLHPGSPFSFSTGEGIGTGKQVGSGTLTAGGADHALMWSGTAASYTDLHPAGFTDSYAVNSNGNQVGFGNDGTNDHALMWAGTAGSVVDLNPAGFSQSRAFGVGGGSQTGWANNGFSFHAMLWSGTAASAVDLHPGAGYTDTFAWTGDNLNQAGSGYVTAVGNNEHALLWAGTNAATDIHPAGFTDSWVYGLTGGVKVGSGVIGSLTQHALLWDSSNVAFDLNPVGYSESGINSLNSTTQVGFGTIGGADHALLWSGTPGSFVDLHSIISTLTFPGPISGSTALGIDPSGNIVGYAFNGSAEIPTATYAFLITQSLEPPVGPGSGGIPEPASGCLLLMGLVMLRKRRQK